MKANIALATLAMFTTVSAYAGSVDQGNVVDFAAGTPAVAAEVNGNFNALIAEIDDNDARITTLEDNASSGNEGMITVNCDTDGLTALADALDSASLIDRLNINASGTCGPILIDRDHVSIFGPVVIQTDGDNNSPVFVNGATNVRLQAVSIDGMDAAEVGLLIVNNASVLAVAVSANSANNAQVLVGFNSNVLFVATNNIGGSDGADGLLVHDSSIARVFTNSTLNLNTFGKAIELRGNASFNSGATGAVLNVPNGTEIEASMGSSLEFVNATLNLTDRLTLRGNSNLRVELELDTDAFTLTGELRIDNGSTVIFDNENALPGAVTSHTGSIEVGPNSSLDAFGIEGTSNSIILAQGVGSVAQSAGAGTFVLNSASLEADEVNAVFGGIMALADFSSLAADAAVLVDFSGQLLAADGVVNAAQVTCGSNGNISAVEFGGVDLCL